MICCVKLRLMCLFGVVMSRKVCCCGEKTYVGSIIRVQRQARLSLDEF